jgi:DNA polymerase-3 subunit epsilon
MPRLKRYSSFWIFILLCLSVFAGVAGGLFYILWQQLPEGDKQTILEVVSKHTGEIIAFGAILLVGVAFILDWISRLYILPLIRLAEEASIIFWSNPSQRIRLHGSREAMHLSAIINRAAERMEELQRAGLADNGEAESKLGEEKDMLSVVIAELPAAVLVCNPEGMITLYNEKARQLLGEFDVPPEQSVPNKIAGFIGLGRSVFNFLEKNLVASALEDISIRLRRGSPDLRSSLVTMGKTGRLLKIDVVPLLSEQRQIIGMALIITDVTHQFDAERKTDLMFHTLITNVRKSAGSIRSAIEVILGYPEMPADKRAHLQEVIRNESVLLSQEISAASAHYEQKPAPSSWPVATMQVNHLMEAVARKALQKFDLQVAITPDDGYRCIRAESYSLTTGFLYLLDLLKTYHTAGPLKFQILPSEGFVGIDIVWSGLPVRMETLKQWEDQVVAVAGEQPSMSLKDILSLHLAQVWSHTIPETQESYLRVLLPAVETKTSVTIKKTSLLPFQRPVFFDFDLFHQPEQSPELDNRRLTELAYTVFDTETTGLDPGRDEIVAIGAVRIINGRILQNESFEQLVNPGRNIPWSSVRIHGLRSNMLADQPLISEALPVFHRFAENTILVGHNAAFDMRMLKEKEALTKVRFGNPVLDTMLLSNVIHPAQSSHDLEGISERLGVNLIGRHTALGDAIGTAEIFLKLIPLLEAMGLTTLGQVRQASEKSYYARLKY